MMFLGDFCGVLWFGSVTGLCFGSVGKKQGMDDVGEKVEGVSTSSTARLMFQV